MSKDRVRLCYEKMLRKYRVGKGHQVLTLLGEKTKELLIYDRLGLPRQNIHVVEHDPRVQRKLVSRRLGVQLHFGSLGNYVDFMRTHNSQKTFDVVNADFCGSFWDYQEGLQRLLPMVCASKAKILSITTLNRRDPLLIHVGKMAANVLAGIIGHKRVRYMKHELIRQFDSHFPSTYIETVKWERELAFGWWLATSLEIVAQCLGKRFVPDYCMRYGYASSLRSTMCTWMLHFTERKGVDLVHTARLISDHLVSNQCVYFGSIPKE